jgi:CBS domain-containing protein
MDIAKNYMNSPISIEKTVNLDQVLKKIIHEKKSRLLVTDNGKISDIVSEKDLGLFLFIDASERKLDQIPVTEVSKKVISVDENTPLDKCAEIMLENGIGSLGVSSGENTVGILTKSDLVKYFTSAHQGSWNPHKI